MAKPDYAHKLTDAELAKLEQRIAKLYKEAADELTDTVKAYFKQFEKRDAAMKEKLDAGEITEQQYKQWRLAQMGRGKRFTALRDKVAERYTDANATAVAYVNDATPGIYSLNRNYAAYKIEQVSSQADFTLWDEQTVKRLIVEQPDLMPYYPPKRALKRGIDLKYGKQQITASVTSSILQGKGIGKIADDLQSRMQDMSRASAIRTARTAITAAQNAGRLDTYHAAQDMGIKLKKQWLATLDNRTRHAHAMLDGQTVDVDKPFKVDGYEIMYPGDSFAPGYLVYNCRCTQVSVLDDVDTSGGMRWARDPETRESVLVKDMTYAEWAGWKKEIEKPAVNAFGKQISFDAKIAENERFNQSVSLIKQLSTQYKTKLQEVRVGSKNSAGSVQISGTIMNLSSKDSATAIHEFAHSFSMENQTKFGLYDEKDFWKAVRKEWRAYKKDVGDNTEKWISTYEHGSNSVDEFMAEAFTLATLDEYGIEVPGKYGNGLEYAKKVLAIIKRYFAK